MAKKNTQTGYPWQYCSLGGVVRVKISSGEDIAHLGELDQKLWTVLSCPVKGLQFDAKTLQLLDTDGDGKIRVEEVVSAAKWLTSVIKDKDLILKGDSSLPLAQINTENETGEKLYKSAKQILANLGLEKDEISVADTSDSVAIFAKTRFNGDGVITPASAEDEALKALVSTIVEKMGGVADRSGETGINADIIEKFYAECAEYAAWQKAAADTKEATFPYGDNTAAALAACDAVKEKVADYFTRCKLLKYNEEVAKAVEVAVTKVDEIASCPLARPCADQILPYDSVNPAWQAAFDAVKALVLDVDYPGKTGITEAEWNASLAKFGAYTAWQGAKKATAVESLGLEAVEAVLAADQKASLLALVAEDKALEEEANEIADVDKLLHYYRDFYQLLRNYVIMTDFYSPKPGVHAIFEAGKLYIDQRCCKLCIKVEDMGAHAAMASLSGMFLIYCKCTSKTKGTTMDIAAVMTDGSVNNLRPGLNAIFYDLDGNDYDAVVTKVVDNPISIKQAFWSPYRKFANTVTDRINKSAAEKESKVSGDMTAKANSLSVPATEEEKAAAATAAKPAPFDIAKFAGIFAAIGMAVGFIGDLVLGLIKPPTNLIWLILLLVICISGPSMFLAWQKLRKRNLGPVLNANGWAINSSILVNIIFGGTLTSIAKYPKLNLEDPYAEKKTPFWKKALWVIIILAVVAACLYFSGNLAWAGFPCNL